VRYVTRPDDLGAPDLIVLPGTKATIADLDALRASGLASAIAERHRTGTPVLGVCGGFQMLGESLRDPDGVEASAGTAVAGLGLLPMVTTFAADKITRRVSGTLSVGAGAWSAAQGIAIEGYEIHMGRTELSEGHVPPGVGREAQPFLTLDGTHDGAITNDGLVAGCYLHGLFHNDALRHALLRGLGWYGPGEGSAQFDREREFDRLAQHVRSHLDLDRVRALVWPPSGGVMP
jgi:adenosylcobyric acid synthase